MNCSQWIKMEEFVGIEYVEDYEIGDYPCINCNIVWWELDEITRIYCLPLDPQYYETKIDHPGEFIEITIAEEEVAGFTRVFEL